MSFRRPIPGTFTTRPRRVSFAVGRRTVPMRDISGEVVPGKPIPGSRSSTIGSVPLSRSSQASMSPTGPPPTITMSAWPARARRLRGHG